MTTINVGDTVRHTTRPDITGTVASVAQLRNRLGVYVAGHRGAYNPADLTVVQSQFKPGDQIRRVTWETPMVPVGSEWTIDTVSNGGESVTLKGDPFAEGTGRTASTFELVTPTLEIPEADADPDTAYELGEVDGHGPAVQGDVDGWWDLAADGDGEWHVYPADAESFGLEVRVQVRRKPAGS